MTNREIFEEVNKNITEWDDIQCLCCEDKNFWMNKYNCRQMQEYAQSQNKTVDQLTQEEKDMFYNPSN